MKNMLDGDLLWRYTQLSRVERHELAKKIGTTQDQVGLTWVIHLCLTHHLIAWRADN